MRSSIAGHFRRNLVGYLALTVAVIGIPTAWAVGRNSVGSPQLKPGAVRKSDIAPDAVTSPKVEDRSLQAEDFALGELPAGPPGQQGPQGFTGPEGPAGSPDTAAQIRAKLGLSSLETASERVVAVQDGNFHEAILIDGPEFDIVGRCLENPPFAIVQAVVRSGNQVTAIGVDSQAPGGIDSDFESGAPPADRLLLNQSASPNQIFSGGFSVAALDAAGLPSAQMVGQVSAGMYVDNEPTPGVSDCFFAVSGMS